MRTRWILLSLCLTATALVSGCGSVSPIEPPAELTKIQPELDVEPRWAVQLDKGVGKQYVKLAPLVDGDRVYAANLKGRVVALDREKGSRVWQVELRVPVTAGPADAGDLILLGGDAEVLALSKEDGKMRWRAPLSSEVLADPVSQGDLVVARSVDGGVFGLSRIDGQRIWRFDQSVTPLSLRGTSVPVFAANMVLIGFSNGRVVALNALTGQPQWEAIVAVPSGRTELERMVDVDGNLAVSGGIAYAAAYQGRIAAISTGSGRLLWARDISSHTGVTIIENELYVTDEHGDVWSLAGANGGTLWKQSALHGRRLSAAAVQGEFLVVADFDGYLHWLNREDGRLAARMRIEDPFYYWPIEWSEVASTYREDRAGLAAPRVRGEMVYAMDKRGVLGAFHVIPAP